MTAPGRRRKPKGNARRDSLADKDDQATAKQAREHADLLARMRAKSQRSSATWTPVPRLHDGADAATQSTGEAEGRAQHREESDQ